MKTNKIHHAIFLIIIIFNMALDGDLFEKILGKINHENHHEYIVLNSKNFPTHKENNKIINKEL